MIKSKKKKKVKIKKRRMLTHFIFKIILKNELKSGVNIM